MAHLTDDLLGLLDDVGEERAAFVGHDWGSMVVWQLALLHPERVTGVVGMSVPFMPRPPMPPIQMLRQVMGDYFFYMLYFQEPGVADADLGRDPATTMRRMLCGATHAADEDARAEAMTRMFAPGPAGLRRPDARARRPARLAQPGGARPLRRRVHPDGLHRRHQLVPQPRPQLGADARTSPSAKVEVPSLFIGGADDPVLVMSPPGVDDEHLADHRGNVIVEGAGHWVQQEKPDEVNAALLDFLDRLQREVTLMRTVALA